MARNATRVLLALLTTGILVAGGLLAGLYLGGASWVVNRVLAKVNPYPGTTLRSARVGGNLFRVVRVYDVRLTRSNGELAGRLDSLTLTYNAGSLFGGGVVIRKARLHGVNIVLTKRPGAKWDLLDLPRGRSDPTPASTGSTGAKVTIDSVSISRGSALVRLAGEQGHRVEDLEAEGAGLKIGGGVHVTRATVRLRLLPQDGAPPWVAVEARGSLAGPELRLDTLSVRTPESVIAARGTVPLPPGGGRRLDLRRVAIVLTARPLAWSDLRILKPDAESPGTVSLTLVGRGEANGAAVHLTAESSDGGKALVDGFLTSPGATPREYRGEITVRGLDPSLITLDAARGDEVSGNVRFDVRGASLDRLDGRARVRLHDSRYRAFHAHRLSADAELTDGRSDVDLEGELGPFRVTVDGWLRAFDSVPAYDLTARVSRAPRGVPSPWLDRLLGAGGSHLFIRARGQELDPDLADLRAVVGIVPGSGSPGLLDSGAVQARLVGGAAEVRGRVGATGGLLTLRANGRLGREPRYRIEGDITPAMDLAALLGAGTPSALSGGFVLDGQGTRPETMRGSARLSPRGSYGSHQFARTDLTVELASGTARLTGRGFLNGAWVELGVTGRPFDTEPALTVKSLRFRHLDVARLTGSGPATDLSGTATLTARGRDLRGLRSRGELFLGPSRIGAHAIDTGAVAGSLARGDLDLRLSLRSPAGALALAGTARPLDSVPRYAVREATFHEVEL
ncbi:MAG TPA: hypothetical protein VFR62_08315, partial [Gemmatimonadales bacterium]|nr:hypothetical protein [Gemmatimonadales bacterium]